IVERRLYQPDWGYLLFRMDYNDECKWDKFEQEFNGLIDENIREEIHFIRTVEDFGIMAVVEEIFQGISLAQVQEYVIRLLFHVGLDIN
ncbi:MAG: hypothetical protein Q9219_007605, partial [cf. Caloplaca sp. 3 TL-2023]